MKTFEARPHSKPLINNAELARDFLDLSFRLEDGTQLPIFTRFEGQITVRVGGPAPDVMSRDLDHLLARLRDEAGLNIRKTDAETASITVIPVRDQDIKRIEKDAACFVRPNVSSWEEFRGKRRAADGQWTNLRSRQRMGVIIPVDVSPQEMRDCLHEEIAQALGPANDLFRLPQSVFNDDNIHSVLTGFDMLVLKAYYDPGLQNGMKPHQVAQRLPRILQAINPLGGLGTISAAQPDHRNWQNAMLRTHRRSISKTARRAAAREAVKLAEQAGLSDVRLAYSHFILGRLSIGHDDQTAFSSLQKAARIYANRPDTALQEARVALSLSAYLMSAGRAEEAIALINRNLSITRQAENAAMLAQFLMIRSEAHFILGNADMGKSDLQEALAWARYGFGSAAAIEARLTEIQTISPRARQGEAA